eukprot:974438-Rhodomonas_salina.5
MIRVMVTRARPRSSDSARPGSPSEGRRVTSLPVTECHGQTRAPGPGHWHARESRSGFVERDEPASDST